MVGGFCGKPKGYNNDEYYTELTLDEMGIWKRVLTTSEISALYNSGTGSIVTEAKSPTWTGDTNGSPITILSNGRINLDKKEFVVEDINIDNSSIYLTSTQRIPIVLGSDNKPNSLTGCITLGGNESQYIGSQLLGVSDRVILKARKDLVVIDSPLGIVLNSTGEIKLGSEDATESMVHGDVLLDILSLIINQFNTVIDPNTYDYINKSNSIKAQKKLQELLSSKYFINKNTY